MPPSPLDANNVAHSLALGGELRRVLPAALSLSISLVSLLAALAVHLSYGRVRCVCVLLECVACVLYSPVASAQKCTHVFCLHALSKYTTHTQKQGPTNSTNTHTPRTVPGPLRTPSVPPSLPRACANSVRSPPIPPRAQCQQQTTTVVCRRRRRRPPHYHRAHITRISN